jgi:hypothetical protein
VLQRSQLLTPHVAPLVLLCYKTADKSWMGKGPDCYYDKQWSFVTQILRNGYQSYVVERKTFEVLTSSWTLGTLGSVASLLEATLGQGNHDRNHKLSNIGSSKKLFYLIIYWEIRLPINQLCLLSQILYESLKPLLTGLSYLEELMTRKKCVLQVEKNTLAKPMWQLWITIQRSW